MVKVKEFFKKKAVRIIIIVIVIAIAGAVIWNKVSGTKKEVSDSAEMTAEAARGNIKSVIAGKGTLKPREEYEVKSLVKGEVLQSPFKEGELVKKGALLYQVSTSEMNSTLNSAKLAVEKAQENYNSLVSQKSDLVIRAGKSGYVTQVYVENGDMVAAGTPLADLSDDSGMKLTVQFPAASVSSTWKGKKASIILDVTGERVTGKVTDVGRKEKALSGGILVKEVTISVPNSGALATGDTASAAVNAIESMNSGTLVVKGTGQIKAKASGQVTGLSIKKDDWVKEGQQVASLSSRDLNVQIQSAENGIKDANNSLEAQQDQVKSYRITSPIGGEVITKNKKKGDVIDPVTDNTAGPMAIIYDMSSLKVEMSVDELDILKVKVGQKVVIKASAIPDKEFEGVVEQVSLNGATESGVTTYPVTVEIKEYGEMIPGMNINGQIILDGAEDVLTIPSACLQRGDVVYLKDADSMAKKKKPSGKKEKETEPEGGIPEGYKEVKVTVGINDGVTVEIKSGLKEGDKIYLPPDSSEEEDGNSDNMMIG